MKSGELYYLIGKPNQIKNDLLYSLNKLTKQEKLINIQKTVTTDEYLKDHSQYSFVTESDFNLRKRMGLYCLDWTKKGHSFGISGEISPLLNKGVNVLLNGSFQNVMQAVKQFPLLNVIMIKSQTTENSHNTEGYPLLEDDGVSLEWVAHANGVYCPYVLTMIEHGVTDKAAELIIDFTMSEQVSLDKAV